jgi:hypothetical protein
VQTPASRRMEQSASPSPTVASLLVWTNTSSAIMLDRATALRQDRSRAVLRHRLSLWTSPDSGTTTLGLRAAAFAMRDREHSRRGRRTLACASRR